MWEYEENCWAEGFSTVCGVDEAGAGPLAGPVCAAAVVLPRHTQLRWLNDSKQVTPRRREILFDEIQKIALAWSVTMVSAEQIDKTDILSARMEAMQRAIEDLVLTPDMALIDGNRDKGKHFTLTAPHRCVVKGDSLSASIAAASILAKVSLDRYMVELAGKYPAYGFDQHKGYGTALHYEMLDRYGPCPEHRRSFLKKWEARR